MKLIIGLGNPGAKYQKTRHNLGFLAVDVLANSLQTTDYSKRDKKTKWSIDKKLQSAVVREASAIIVKPQTYVNNSGEAVGKIAQFYKIKPANILIIRDDIDLPEGKIRGPKAVTGSGGHLGMESIIKNLKTDTFYQLKIGVGRPAKNMEPADFVLRKISEKERGNFKNLIVREVVAKVQDWING